MSCLSYGNFTTAVNVLGQLVIRLPLSQMIVVIEMLLKRLENWSCDVQVAIVINLSQLVLDSRVAQVTTIIETVKEILLIKLRDEYNSNLRANAASSLGQLTMQLSELQVKEVFKQLLLRLAEEYNNVQVAAMNSLVQLTVRLPELHVRELVEKLILKLNDKNWDIKTTALKSLTKIFSATTTVQWLQNNLLDLNNKDTEDYQTFNVQKHSVILFKVFSYLKKETLLQAVPQVNRDWRRWQKVYLQQQAEQQQMHSILSSQENTNDSDEPEIMLENNFNRFLSS